jgi:rSAM/selenodomain-associated transferase 1
MSDRKDDRNSMLEIHIIVMAKEPRAGTVKTRLCPPLTPVEAAGLARAALIDTLHVVARTNVRAHSVILEGDVGDWLPSSCAVIVQRQGDFAHRLAGAMEDAWDQHQIPIVLIGMDTPQVNSGLLASCARSLLQPDVDAVLGRAADGGYWIIGSREPVAGMFDGVPMSTDRTADVQLEKLEHLGLRTTLLPMLRDVDEFDDALAVAASAPDTEFARAVKKLSLGLLLHD